MNYLKKLSVITTTFFILTINAQTTSISEFKKDAIIKPSILSTHPFGLFFMRLEGRFKPKPTTKTNLDFSLASGNVWSPPVTVYIPNLQSDRNFVSQFEWHNREFRVDKSTLDAKTIEIQNDGVIKAFNVKISIPINDKSEILVTAKAFMLTSGNSIFSILTSDRFIETFHDKIAGGNDPFDRKLYPYNQAYIRYKDRNNNLLELTKNTFIFNGIETAYYYYPKVEKLNNKGYFLNFGSHLGINTSKYNSSIDFGLNTNIIKSFNFKNKSINIGLSIGGVYKDVVEFENRQIDFGTNPSIGYLESIVEYKYQAKSGSIHAFGADFYLQTSLNKKNELDYYIPTKNGTSFKQWNIGAENLYKNNNYWTFMYSFSKKLTYTFYLQQDLTVNNHPDIQTGLRVKFAL